MKKFKRIIPFLAAALMALSLTACGAANKDAKADPAASSSSSTEEAKAFPKFQGSDFDGKAVDESIFGQNSVTVLNFWFNGCSACVDEMPALEEFNQKLREKGAELVGINVEAGDDIDALNEAKEILAKQGASYRNLALASGKEIDEYLSKIYSFPTTVLIDNKGNIIGDPILGSIDDEERMNSILKMVDDAAAGKTVSSTTVSSTTEDTQNDEISALIEEENAIYSEHMDIWSKVLDSIPHEKAASLDPMEYLNLLKEQVKSMKDSFTEDELAALNDDLRKLEDIEQKISSAEN